MDKNPNHVTCPQSRRTKTRRSEQAKWRASKEWKALVEAHARVPEEVCNHCGKKHGEMKKNGKKVVLTINHLSRSLYESKELYCTWNEDLMEICCTVCNWMYEKGKKPCPRCHDQYIKWNEDICQPCYDREHPVEAKLRKDARKAKKKASNDLRNRLNRELRKKVKDGIIKKQMQDLRCRTPDSGHAEKVL